MEGSAHRRWSTAGECKHSAPLLLLSSHPTALSEPLTLLLDSPLTDRHRRALPAWLTCVRSVSPNQARPPPPVRRRIWTSNVPSAERTVPSILRARKMGGSWYTLVRVLLPPRMAPKKHYKEEEGRRGQEGGQVMRRRGAEEHLTTFLKVRCGVCLVYHACGNGFECIYL